MRAARRRRRGRRGRFGGAGRSRGLGRGLSGIPSRCRCRRSPSLGWSGWISAWDVLKRGFSLTFDEGHRRVAETLSSRLGRGDGSKLGRVCPSSDREQRLHVPVLLLEEVQLLDAAVGIVSLIVPRVCGVVLLKVRVAI